MESVENPVPFISIVCPPVLNPYLGDISVILEYTSKTWRDLYLYQGSGLFLGPESSLNLNNSKLSAVDGRP